MSTAKRKREDGQFRRRDGGGRYWHPTGRATAFGVHGEPDVKLNADQLRAYELSGRSEPAIMAAKSVLSPRSALRIQTPPLQRCTHRTAGCAALKRRRHSPARSTCADASGVRSSPLGADMVGKSSNMSADMLFMPGLLALMSPIICCVRSQSVRDLVTEISGGATPAPVRYGSEL